MKTRYDKKCEIILNDEVIPLEENRSKITFYNKHKVAIRKIEVDPCAIPQETRCDWLLIRPDDKEFFVELKGSNLKHAFEQIEKSIELIAKDCYVRDKNIYIIISNFPKKKPNTQVERKYFQDKYNAKLMVERTNYIVEDIQTA
ncbi:MAG: hypothetical protein HQK91_08055 [Nitrospirae bacterium]|nr:hypothetical protein [Nitrospirota bacterium]MBF0541388.1 hypothetical protein [Nitrospirota bacterium]